MRAEIDNLKSMWAQLDAAARGSSDPADEAEGDDHVAATDDGYW
jgi:hypothetical protein|eukprot:COSAG01_NODE_22230_length_865_cov_4.312010_2_plen_44_part_00